MGTAMLCHVKVQRCHIKKEKTACPNSMLKDLARLMFPPGRA
jgi:hypothetical protein